MSRRGGFSSSSGGGFSSFNSFVQNLPTMKECANTPTGGIDGKKDPSTSFNNEQFSNIPNTNDNFNKENVNGVSSSFPPESDGKSGFQPQVNGESLGHSNFGTPTRSGRGGFRSTGSEESSGHSSFGAQYQGGRGGFHSTSNEESSGQSNFGAPSRGGRGGFHSTNNEESSGHNGFGAPSRGGRGGFGSGNNEESSGYSNYGSSNRGGRGGFHSTNNEESSGHNGFGAPSRGGRGGFGSRNDDESSSGRSNFGGSGRGGRGGFGSSNNEESSGHGNFGTSSRGGRGSFGSSNNEDSSRYSNFGGSGRGGRGGFGSSNNEESSGHTNFGSSNRGGRGSGFGRNDYQDDGDVTDFLGNMHGLPKRNAASHVPIDRSIDILLEEDQRNNVYYSQIADQDDEIIVEGAKYQIKFESWADCEFSKPLMENIKLTGYVRPRNIQAYTMPQICNGYDIKGQAETGSGKTAAFLLPIIDDIIVNSYERRPRSPIALIISPTRELALQTHEQGRKFANNTGVTVAKCYGQYKISENIAELERGCDILSSTPGRLKSFVQNGDISLECLKYFVLDEADELFGDSFVDTIREILLVGGAPPKENRINMLFSATFPTGINELANELLRKDYVTIVNKCMNGANRKVTHTIMQVDRNDKNVTVCNMLLKEKEEAEGCGNQLKRTLVFVSKKQQADMLSMFFCERGINALSLNGDRPQKLREEALNDFRAHKISVLVTTDVCARGIDIKDLDHVINVDLPTEFVTFVHRVGRTGRLREGFATSFYDPNNDYNLKEDLVDVLRFNNKEVPDFLL